MADWAELIGSGRMMLLVGAVLLYVASRAGAEVLAGKEALPGRRAVGHWIPIAAAALVAVAIHRGDMAISIIFASSVGCLSLVVGSICIVSPNSDVPAGYGRMWPLALPAALLTLLAGFSGELNWKHALVLLIEGAALGFAWKELGGGGSAVAAEMTEKGDNRREIDGLRWANVGLCVLLAMIGGIAGVVGAVRVGRDFPAIPDVAMIVAVLGPILVLPMLTGGAALAQSNRGWAAITSAVAVVLLNLCVLLPVVALIWYPAQMERRDFLLGSIHRVLGGLGNAGPLPFSWVTWRVDNVVLVLLSFVLIPASLGKWRLGRMEGITLIALYAVYVLMEAAGRMRG
jgi:Ca2+/Na+ antiporter